MADTAELAIVHATTASASWLTDPTVFAANRKPAHSSHRYVIGETSEPKQSLDGEWKVRIEQARNVDVESAPFAAVDFEDGDFGAIEVPGHLQMAGYLKNKYVNIQYPWDGHEDPQAPNIPENNHVAIYRRRFALDAQLARTLENDGTVSLTFHGAATAIYVWLDGTFVGYGEDGFTPSEFDVTEALRNGNGNAADSPEAEHTLTVACYEYSSASWLEDQDSGDCTACSAPLSSPPSRIRTSKPCSLKPTTPQPTPPVRPTPPNSTRHSPCATPPTR